MKWDQQPQPQPKNDWGDQSGFNPFKFIILFFSISFGIQFISKAMSTTE